MKQLIERGARIVEVLTSFLYIRLSLVNWSFIETDGIDSRITTFDGHTSFVLWSGSISADFEWASRWCGELPYALCKTLCCDWFIYKILAFLFTFINGQLKLNLKLKIFHLCLDKFLDFLIRRIRTWSLTLNLLSNLIYSSRAPPNCHVHKSVIPNQLFSSTIFRYQLSPR